MIAKCEHMACDDHLTFLRNLTMPSRGKPKWESMTIEDGEEIVKILEGSVENLKRCLAIIYPDSAEAERGRAMWRSIKGTAD